LRLFVASRQRRQRSRRRRHKRTRAEKLPDINSTTTTTNMTMTASTTAGLCFCFFHRHKRGRVKDGDQVREQGHCADLAEALAHAFELGDEDHIAWIITHLSVRVVHHDGGFRREPEPRRAFCPPHPREVPDRVIGFRPRS